MAKLHHAIKTTLSTLRSAFTIRVCRILFGVQLTYLCLCDLRYDQVLISKVIHIQSVALS